LGKVLTRLGVERHPVLAGANLTGVTWYSNTCPNGAKNVGIGPC